MTPWTKPELIEVNMSAEIGAYQPDEGPGARSGGAERRAPQHGRDGLWKHCPDFVERTEAEAETTDDAG